MDITTIVRIIRRRFFSKKYKDARQKQSNLLNIVKTQAFSKMTLQDKILSIAKLIALFRCDFGITPRKLEMALLHYNNDLTRQLSKPS